ncbi:MAG: hypothetical protein QOJ19_3457 [Acidimicrobiia bacterium]|jgi:DNA-binding MarR family transcriptional regulator|nr:hypothetical protein [Acidimicrobiia bacterium]
MVFVDVEDVTLAKRISDFDLRVFLFLCRRMSKTNEVRLNQAEIATELNVYQPRISRAIKALREAKYLTTRGHGKITISAEYAWRDALAKNADARGD